MDSTRRSLLCYAAGLLALPFLPKAAVPNRYVFPGGSAMVLPWRFTKVNMSWTDQEIHGTPLTYEHYITPNREFPWRNPQTVTTP